MISDFSLTDGLVIWLAVLAVVLYIQGTRATLGVGLVLAYYLNLALIHIPGALLYLNPDYAFYKRSWIQLGFEQSTYAILGFGIGAVGTFWLLHQTRQTVNGDSEGSSQGVLFNPWLHRLYVAMGLVSYLIISPLTNTIPSLGAVVSIMNQLMLVGICLGLWNAWRGQQWRALFFWIGALGLLPAMTIIIQGFLGFGTTALLIGLAFLAGFFRPRWLVVVAGVVFIALGASVFVTYFRDRTEIRKVVWGDESFGNRIDQVVSTFSEFEWFDPNNAKHLNAIDERLNQNWIVGAAVENISNGKADFKNGSTLVDAAIAFVPRVLWPDKPVSAGSGTLVSDATGVAFASGTSVGVGQVLEFYLNFGTTGVIVGALFWGIALALLDAAAAHYLWAGNAQQFTLYYLIALGLIQPGGSLVDIAATTAAALVTAVVVNEALVPFFIGVFQEDNIEMDVPQDLPDLFPLDAK